MLNSIKAELIRRGWDLNRHQTLLALSGGKDSVALFWCFRELKIPFEAAHINYGLRGEESDGDEQFVRRLCEDQSVVLHVLPARACPLQSGESTQMWARRIRYEFFEGILSRRKLDFIAVAHHAGDQLEHFFIYLSRNQTEKAWRGILPQNGKVVRPMLRVLPSQVKEYLTCNDLTWREDSSNLKLQYLRNKVRHGIIGMMEEPEVAMKEFSLVSEKMYQAWRHQELAHSDSWQWEELKQGFWKFNRSDLQKFPFVWKQILMQLGFAAVCWKYLVSGHVRVGACFLSNQGYRVVGARDGMLMLFRDVDSDFSLALDCKDTIGFEFSGQHFRFIRATDLKEGMQVLGVLPQKIEDKKGLLRCIKPGDRIPLSGGGSQKVSDFMTNKKWDPFQKSRALGLEVEGKLFLVFSLGCIQEKWNLKDGLLVVSLS